MEFKLECVKCGAKRSKFVNDAKPKKWPKHCGKTMQITITMPLIFVEREERGTRA